MNFPSKKYNIIYADPPWRYRSEKSAHARKNKAGLSVFHYPSVSLSELKALKIPTEKDAALFLWVTYPMLQEGLELIDAWGFKYKTNAFTWIKTTKSGKPAFGVGHYTRSNAEVCLLGLKGRLPVLDHSISSVVISPKEQHSKKPDIVRDKIVQLYGDLPRIELFARQKTPGWDVWGDEV